MNIGVRDYDYFINSKVKIYPRQVRVGSEFEGKEHIIFDIWEWHKGSEDQQLVNFNTFHVNGEGEQHTASKFVTTFRALFREEMEQLMAEAGFVDIKVCFVVCFFFDGAQGSTSGIAAFISISAQCLKFAEASVDKPGSRGRRRRSTIGCGRTCTQLAAPCKYMRMVVSSVFLPRPAARIKG